MLNGCLNFEVSGVLQEKRRKVLEFCSAAVGLCWMHQCTVLLIDKVAKNDAFNSMKRLFYCELDEGQGTFLTQCSTPQHTQ